MHCVGCPGINRYEDRVRHFTRNLTHAQDIRAHAAGFAIISHTGCSLGQSAFYNNEREQYCLIPSPGQAWPSDVTVDITCKIQISTTPNSLSVYSLQLLHGVREISRSLISDNVQHKVVHIHNFTESDTGNYTCRARLVAAGAGGLTTREDTTEVAIDSSLTPCAKPREQPLAKARPRSSNRVAVDIDVSISERWRPQVPNSKPALNRPTTSIISATEYGTKHLTSPSQSSTTSEVSQSCTQHKICTYVTE